MSTQVDDLLNGLRKIREDVFWMSKNQYLLNDSTFTHSLNFIDGIVRECTSRGDHALHLSQEIDGLVAKHSAEVKNLRDILVATSNGIRPPDCGPDAGMWEIKRSAAVELFRFLDGEVR
jgi:hypothetical protein